MQTYSNKEINEKLLNGNWPKPSDKPEMRNGIPKEGCFLYFESDQFIPNYDVKLGLETLAVQKQDRLVSVQVDRLESVVEA